MRKKQNNIYSYFLNNLKLLAFACFLLGIASVICWYFIYSREANYIFPAEGQSKFEILGQAGDYFGGILNPIFGFLTVIILLITLHKNDKNMEEDRFNIAESNRHKKIEQISIAIESATNKINKDIYDNRIYYVGGEHDSAHSYIEFYFHHSSHSEYQALARAKSIDIISDSLARNIEFEKNEKREEYPFFSGNLDKTVIYVLKVNHIIQLYIHKIDLEKSGILQAATLYECFDFLKKMEELYLCSVKDSMRVRHEVNKRLKDTNLNEL